MDKPFFYLPACEESQRLFAKCRAAGIGEGIVSSLMQESGIEGQAAQRGYLVSREWKQLGELLDAEIAQRKNKPNGGSE